MSDSKDIDLSDLLTQLEASTSTFVKKGALIPILKWLICRASQIDELLSDTFVDCDEDDEPSDAESLDGISANPVDDLPDDSAQSDLSQAVESKSSLLFKPIVRTPSNPMHEEEEQLDPSSLSAHKTPAYPHRTLVQSSPLDRRGARTGESLLSYMTRMSSTPRPPPL